MSNNLPDAVALEYPHRATEFSDVAAVMPGSNPVANVDTLPITAIPRSRFEGKFHTGGEAYKDLYIFESRLKAAHKVKQRDMFLWSAAFTIMYFLYIRVVYELFVRRDSTLRSSSVYPHDSRGPASTIPSLRTMLYLGTSSALFFVVLKRYGLHVIINGINYIPRTNNGLKAFNMHYDEAGLTFLQGVPREFEDGYRDFRKGKMKNG
ncbi:hypothetical protein BC832DRAFT_589534 [Gaertneriomyces semiglobifer]|nr:hypothetical protein BC832DRAFT_589534 [Gaertneriomyces semiglobifer]